MFGYPQGQAHSILQQTHGHALPLAIKEGEEIIKKAKAVAENVFFYVFFFSRYIVILATPSQGDLTTISISPGQSPGRRQQSLAELGLLQKPRL